MLSRTYDAHKFDNDISRAKADNLKKETMESVSGVTDALVECLNGGKKTKFRFHSNSYHQSLFTLF